MTDIDFEKWSYRLKRIKAMIDHDHKSIDTTLSRGDVNDLMRIIDMAKGAKHED